jgi:hypothetical protein
MLCRYTLLVFAAILLFGCKEKSVVDPALKTDTATLQQVFEKEYNTASFSQTFKDTVQVRWEAQWRNSVVEKVNDSIQIAYIALVPGVFSLNSGKKIPNSNVYGYSNYIVIRIGKAYRQYLATYYNSQILNQPVDRSNFSGTVVFKNLKTNVNVITEYQNGQHLKGWKIE